MILSIIIGVAIGGKIIAIMLDKNKLKAILFKFIEDYLEEPSSKKNKS